jgi:hypothetical protein
MFEGGRMGRPQASFAKRQREQAKKEKKQLKLEKRAQRKSEEGPDDDMISTEVVREEQITE